MCFFFRSQGSLLTALEGWGFEVARPRLAPTPSAEELVEFHRGLARDRASLGYAVDGVVYKLDDLALQVRQGEATHAGVLVCFGSLFSCVSFGPLGDGLAVCIRIIYVHIYIRKSVIVWICWWCIYRGLVRVAFCGSGRVRRRRTCCKR